jgi:hypothetical protein
MADEEEMMLEEVDERELQEHFYDGTKWGYICVPVSM